MQTSKTQYKDFLEVKDQYISALLFSLGMSLDHTRQNNNVVFFVFAEKEKCESIIKDYYQNKLKTNPKAFVDGLITVKHLIFGS